MNLHQKVFQRLYRQAPTVESLPWHRDEPPALLETAVAQRTQKGRALDLGCGEGEYSAYLAEQGFTVVGIDFIPAALAAAKERADKANVHVKFHEANILEYAPDQPFDLVLDSGCLHHLPNSKVSDYRTKLDTWLAPGGDFILVHFAHRPRVPWIPGGPRHMTRVETVKLFAPLELQAYDETHFDVPFPMGRMRAGVYWFTRPSHD
ncbi:MAG: class I SAM-dependent methyltransferase [Acidimicrobiia bacterium]